MRTAQGALYVTDCEGPVTLNDNAHELCEALLPHGDRFFAQLSAYDDYLAHVVRRADYKAGDTLRLVAPFLRAKGLTNDDMYAFARRTLRLLPAAREALASLRALAPCFIISTSYEPYVRAVCERLGFPLRHVYCTEVDLGARRVKHVERKLLEAVQDEIVQMPDIEVALRNAPSPPAAAARVPKDPQVPASAPSLARAKRKHPCGESRRQAPADGLPREVVAALERLHSIFWQQLPATEVGQLLHEIHPVGGSEKARSLTDCITRAEGDPSRAMYVGDSITDVEALRVVDRAGGVAIAFNGNRYAVEAATLACISSSADVLACLGWAFLSGGRKAVLSKIAELGGNEAGLQTNDLATLQQRVRELLERGEPAAARVTRASLDWLSESGRLARQWVRGPAIGRLG